MDAVVRVGVAGCSKILNVIVIGVKKSLQRGNVEEYKSAPSKYINVGFVM